MVENLTAETFDEAIFKSSGLILIDFFATWCGPCKMMAPILEGFAEENDGKLKIYKVDVEAEASLADRLRILSVPTLMVVKDGKIQTRVEGTRDEDGLKELLGI
ncbi:MAG: thioredoxin [Spirochaetaceae bacterium]|nr:thioredoxin [Spirochaetaceae bacterium]